MIQYFSVWSIKHQGKWVRDVTRDGRPVLGRRAFRFNDLDIAEDMARRWFGDDFKIVEFFQA